MISDEVLVLVHSEILIKATCTSAYVQYLVSVASCTESLLQVYEYRTSTVRGPVATNVHAVLVYTVQVQYEYPVRVGLEYNGAVVVLCDSVSLSVSQPVIVKYQMMQP